MLMCVGYMGSMSHVQASGQSLALPNLLTLPWHHLPSALLPQGLQTSVFGAVPGGPSVSAPGSLLNPTYDALAPFDMAKLNAALMLRQQPPLIGTNMHGA